MRPAMNRICAAICILALPKVLTGQDATARFVGSEGEGIGSATLSQTTDAAHGVLSDTGPHVGDMPNQWVDHSSRLRAQVFNT